MIAPVPKSGIDEPPNVPTPKTISCNVAPTNKPVLISPIIIPARKPEIAGLLNCNPDR